MEKKIHYTLSMSEQGSRALNQSFIISSDFISKKIPDLLGSLKDDKH